MGNYGILSEIKGPNLYNIVLCKCVLGLRLLVKKIYFLSVAGADWCGICDATQQVALHTKVYLRSQVRIRSGTAPVDTNTSWGKKPDWAGQPDYL